VAQFKIHGHARVLEALRGPMSEAIHECAVEVLGLPPDKRFHRFFPLADDDFVHPADRSDRYTIVEVLMFAGRDVATKKALYQALYRRFEERLGIGPQDLEIVVVETPRHDWGIRGQAGDELALGYRVEV
jgi:phenylpyruvate tautomerase PptA (4-oxalocrotonate tautomerase family)